MTKLVNRAKMSTATTGTGTVTLGSAVDGYQTYAAAGVSDGDVTRNVFEDGTAWEISTGTYTASGTTLTRTLVESSTGSLLNLSGDAVVYVSATAEDIPPVLELYAENYDGTSTKPSATGTNGIALGRLAVASGTRSISLGGGAVATGLFSTALTNSYASGGDAFAAAISTGSASYGATGANSVAIGGFAKSDNGNSIAIGRNSQATGFGAVAIGGQGSNSEPIASGSASIAIGVGTRADAAFSMALGSRAAVRGIRGKQVWTGYAISGNNDGASQSGKMVLALNTTDATPASLTTFGSPNATNQIILPNNSAYAFHGTIVARQQASQGTACAAWKIEGLIRREGSAGTTVLVNSATTVLDNTPGWGMALSADTTNGGLKIEVTGAAATNIRWVCTAHTSEVTY